MDEIQQKIEDFQKQLLPRQSLLKETLLSCPAVLPAVGLIIGLVLQYYFLMSLLVWFAVLILCIILFLAHIATEPRQLWSGLSPKTYGVKIYLVFISVFLCFACLGSIRLINYNKPALNDIRNIKLVLSEPVLSYTEGVERFEDFTFAHIRAQIISEPRVIVADENDWLFSKFSQSYPYTTFYAIVSEIKTAAGWKKAIGTIKFYISEDANYLNAGDKFQSFCRLAKFSSADNPAQFDTAEFMNRNNVFLSASVKSANAVTILDTEKLKSPFDLKAKFRQYAISALLDNTESDNDMRLVEAMVLGSRTKIDKKLYNDFIKTGLVHLVVLSGLNVGILAAVAWWFTKRAGLLHIGRSIACIIATIVFLLAVPATSSTLRAGIMFIIFCLARLFNRHSNPLNSIALSAIFLLLIRPMDFLDAGFQLSFAATTGIVLFCPSFFNFLISPFGNLKKTYLYSVLQISLAALSTGCTAWLAVAPIIAWHFNQIQLLTAVWTVPACVPATIIIVLSTFKILLNPLLPTLAGGLAFIIDFSAKILSYLVTLFAKVPLSNITIGKIPIYIVLLCYLLLFLWKFSPFKTLARNLIYPAAITLLFIAAFSINKFKNLNNLQLTVLSVGHGQAAFIKTPDNKIFFIDAGSMSKSNIGDTIVNPFLNYIAADRIDSVFISHDDIDHYNGLPEILNQHHCKNFYTTPKFIQSAVTSNADAKLSKFVRSKGLSVCVAPEKISLGKTAISRLWPIDIPDENSLTDNESSLVLLFEYAGRKILLCSDITEDTQKQLMNLYPQLDADLIVTPHHGSGRTADPAFLNCFKPEFLITSCSQAHLGSISGKIKDFGQSYFTCKDGAVTVLINAAGQIRIKSLK
ncbi:MAG: DNA internalization-related competence protein ComEC/Rec2 [Phycisphaerae bacterium]|nr:DNA internalization-related competence protein ComEC/Rec2 [Phycisphaerae bacterium]